MLLPLLYADDQRDGWGEGMRRVTYALLGDVSLPDGPLIEIGCGGGQLLAELRRRYPQRMILGADVNPLALAHARAVLRPTANSTVNLTQAALPYLPWIENQAALLLALDVFDQEGVVLAQALAESYRLLRSGGVLVMRVSAHPSLFGAHDHAFHTGKRYRRDQLQSALVQAGFVVQRLTYANFVLSLPVARFCGWANDGEWRRGNLKFTNIRTLIKPRRGCSVKKPSGFNMPSCPGELAFVPWLANHKNLSGKLGKDLKK